MSRMSGDPAVNLGASPEAAHADMPQQIPEGSYTRVRSTLSPEGVLQSLSVIADTVQRVHGIMTAAPSAQAARAELGQLIASEETGKLFDCLAQVTYHAINLHRIATHPEMTERHEATAAERYVAENSFRNPSAPHDPLHMSFAELFALDALVNTIGMSTGNLYERHAHAILTDPTASMEDKAHDLFDWMSQQIVGGDEHGIKMAARNVAIMLNIIRCEQQLRERESTHAPLEEH